MSDLYSHATGGRGGIESPGYNHYIISASANALDPKPRSIRCQSDGTLTIEDVDAVSVDYAMTAGEVLTFRAHKVTAIASGTFVAWY